MSSDLAGWRLTAAVLSAAYHRRLQSYRVSFRNGTVNWGRIPDVQSLRATLEPGRPVFWRPIGLGRWYGLACDARTARKPLFGICNGCQCFREMLAHNATQLGAGI